MALLGRAALDFMSVLPRAGLPLLLLSLPVPSAFDILLDFRPLVLLLLLSAPFGLP